MEGFLIVFTLKTVNLKCYYVFFCSMSYETDEIKVVHGYTKGKYGSILQDNF